MQHAPRPLLIPSLIALATACSHPLEIEGEGDILSASGDRDCLLEDFQAAQANCTRQDRVAGIVRVRVITLTPNG